MNDQYQQNSWQTSYPQNIQYVQQQGPTTSGNQLPQLQTQANTYSSSSTTTTTQQQTTTSSTHYDQPYIPAYQNSALQASQYFDQSQFSQSQQLQPPVSQPQASEYLNQSQFSQTQQLPPSVCQPQASQHFGQSQFSQTQQLQPPVSQLQASQHFDQSQLSQTQQLQPPVYQPQTVPQQPLCPLSQTTTTQLFSGNTTVQQSQFSQCQQVPPPPPQEYHQTMPQMQPAPQSIPAQLTGTNMTTHQSSSDFQQSLQPAFQPPAVDYTSNQLQVSHCQYPCPPLPQSQTQTTAQQFLNAAPSTQEIAVGGAIQEVSVCVPQLAPPPPQLSLRDSKPPVRVRAPPPAEPSSKTKIKAKAKIQTETKTKTKTKTTTTQTTCRERYKGDDAGGKARKAAEEKGEEEMKRFEKKVQKLIRAIDACPTQHPCYHEDIDMAFKRPGWLPQITLQNTFNDPEQETTGVLHYVHPPEIDLWQPMHRQHRDFMREAASIGATTNALTHRNKDCERKGCNKGMEAATQTAMDRNARAKGYDPLNTRHRMFDDWPDRKGSGNQRDR